MEPFRSNIDINNSLEKIKIFVEIIDAKYGKSVYNYTGEYHNWINLYCQLRNVKLDNIPNINLYFPGSDMNMFKNETFNLINIYQELYNNLEYINLIDNLFKEEFELVSFQTFLYFNDPNGNISDVTSITQERGSIIYMPNFLSASFKFFDDYDKYASSAKVLYRIKIKNRLGMGKKWIVVGDYTQIYAEDEILIKSGSYFVIENIDFVPIDNSTQKYFNMKMITMRFCDDLDDAINFSKQFGKTHLLYNQFEEILLTGGRKIDEKPTITAKANYIINPYTIMINPELFNDKYKNLKNTNDIIEIYQKYYPLFDEVINKYANKISVVNTEKQTHNVKYKEKLPTKIETNISDKYKQTSLQKTKLLNLNVPGLYSESEQQVPIKIQIGGLNNKNGRQFYHKYLKYKLKYLMLTNI
jgi:hypothetical protein